MVLIIIHGQVSYANGDYFGAYMWSLTGNEGSRTVHGNYIPKGRINDIRIYDHVVSEGEIKDLYKCLIAQYTFEERGMVSTDYSKNLLHSLNVTAESYSKNLTFSNQANGGIQERVDLSSNSNTELKKHKGAWHFKSLGANNRFYSSIPVSNGKTYTISCDYYSSSENSQALHIERSGGNYNWNGSNSAYTTINKWQHLSITITNTSDTTLYYFFYGVNGIDFYIDNLRLEEKSSSTEYYIDSETNITGIISDSSGFGYNLKNNNDSITSLSTDSGRGSSCGVFTSVGEASRTSFLAGIIKTVSFWINITAIPSDTRIVFVDGNNKVGFGFYTGNRIIISCGTTSDHRKPVFASSVLPVNGWHLVTIVYKSTTELYIDGVLKTSNGSADYWTYSGTNFCLGGRSNNYFTGKLSDFRIYGRELTADEITHMYHSDIRFYQKGVLKVNHLNISSGNPSNQNIFTNKMQATAKSLNENDSLEKVQIGNTGIIGAKILMADSAIIEEDTVVSNLSVPSLVNNETDSNNNDLSNRTLWSSENIINYINNRINNL